MWDALWGRTFLKKGSSPHPISQNFHQRGIGYPHWEHFHSTLYVGAASVKVHRAVQTLLNGKVLYTYGKISSRKHLGPTSQALQKSSFVMVLGSPSGRAGAVRRLRGRRGRRPRRPAKFMRTKRLQGRGVHCTSAIKGLEPNKRTTDGRPYSENVRTSCAKQKRAHDVVHPRLGNLYPCR